MRIYLAMVCAALAAAAASGQNTQPPAVQSGVAAPFSIPSGRDPKVIIKYWDTIRDMMMHVKDAPPRPSKSAGSPGELRPDYPFENFRNIRAVDLVRAAHEGAVAARRPKAGRQPAEADRQVRENAMLALEYYPLLVREDSDIRAIARIIENRDEDLELRRFVLDKLAPEQKDPSLLSLFLDDAYARYPGQFCAVLGVASSHPAENPAFQTESMRVNYDRLMKRYNDAFGADSKIAAHVKETGQPVPSTALLGENPPEIEKATREKLAGLGVALTDFATLISAHIETGSARTPAVKAETRRILEKIAAEVLLPDRARERILYFLDPSRPVPPAPPPPQSEEEPPPMPDTGNGETLMPPLPGAETGLPIMPQVSQGSQPPPTPVPLPSGL
jgi:hypothetical protein